MYNKLSDKTKSIISSRRGELSPFAFKDENALRRTDNPHDKGDEYRSNFIKDGDKIINCPFFSRYQDKTQVFSFFRNDDITRRWLHVQFVSRTARSIGKALGLNLELIEAIALGHDLGHTPFGHVGEYALDRVYFKHTGKRFMHNLQSVRVLDKVFNCNLSLQTLDGILCHNGELELSRYTPSQLNNFKDFDGILDKCESDSAFSAKLLPCTLEGCVVRIADIIAYLGKDRQDAERAIKENIEFSESPIGNFNAEIINNMSVNIIENSIDKPYIEMDEKYFQELSALKKENYDKIYLSNKTLPFSAERLSTAVEKLYEKLLEGFNDENSYLYKHHINYLKKCYHQKEFTYLLSDKHKIVCDYIASMTDDYFIDLYNLTFPKDAIVHPFKGYFD